MLRKLTLLLIPIVVLAAVACGDDGDDDGDAPAGPTSVASPTEASAATAEPTSEATPVVIATPDIGDGSGVLSTFSPFDLLESFDSTAGFTGDVDPSLKDGLLSAGDLPSDYVPMGEFSFAAPSEYGELQMAASMFSSSEAIESGEIGTMVMSAAIAIPPEAMDEFSAEALNEIRDFSDEDLAEALGGAEGFGEFFGELRVLDGDDLGDGGVGIHMEMDLSGLAAAFGAPATDEGPASIAMDMYMFIVGDQMRMVVAMYTGGETSGVDAHDLAEIVAGRNNGGSA